MTRLLTLVAVGMAIALAPTPGEAQRRKVPDYFNLLDRDQEPEDGVLTRSDFSDPELAQSTQACIDQIRGSATFKNLPQDDKKRLNRLYKIAGGGEGRVRADSEGARQEFIREHPDLELEEVGC